MKKLIVVIFLIFMAENFAQVSVIVNKSVSESSVNSSKLSSIYSLSQTKWSDGSKIVVFDQSSDNDQKASFYKFIAKEPQALKKEWLKKQFSGEAKAPESLSSDDDVLKKVASTPGAIGYVKSSSVNSNVKVLLEIK